MFKSEDYVKLKHRAGRWWLYSYFVCEITSFLTSFILMVLSGTLFGVYNCVSPKAQFPPLKKSHLSINYSWIASFCLGCLGWGDEGGSNLDPAPVNVDNSPLWESPHLWAGLWEEGCQHVDCPLSSTSGSVGRSESGSPYHDRTWAGGTGRPTPGTDLLEAWPEGWGGCSTTGGPV